MEIRETPWDEVNEKIKTKNIKAVANGYLYNHKLYRTIDHALNEEHGQKI